MENTHSNQLTSAVQAVKERDFKNIYFVACGGSLAYMHNQQYVFDVETSIPTFVINSGEFMYRNPKSLGADSLVVLCSHSGNTPETVDACVFANENNALTVAYSNQVDSPLWNEADFGLHYDWGEKTDAYENRAGMALRFTFGILNALNPSEKYNNALEAVKTLDELFNANRERFKSPAEEFGRSHKRESIIYTMGSGPVFGDAYSFAVCLLQEMQWVHSAAIHSGEFFHGPFEITDYDVPFLLTKTIGNIRQLDERAHLFLKRYCDRVTVLDAEDFDWKGMNNDLKEYFAGPIFGAVLRTYAEHLAEYRGHPLTVRRYMWKMEY